MRLLLLLSLFLLSEAYPQDKKDCKVSYYRGKLISKYNIYEVKALGFDTLSIKQNDIISILEAFNDDKVIKAINGIISSPIFLELANKYALSYEHDQFSLDSYADKYIGKDIYTDYVENKNVLDSTTKGLITNKNKILNISLYSHLENLGDCYFYQMGYDGFNLKIVSSAVITSVLYNIDDLGSYKNNLLGLEVTETGQIVIIPFVLEGKYICDIRLMLCPGT